MQGKNDENRDVNDEETKMFVKIDNVLSKPTYYLSKVVATQIS
jgi:hypothetical protein